MISSFLPPARESTNRQSLFKWGLHSGVHLNTSRSVQPPGRDWTTDIPLKQASSLVFSHRIPLWASCSDVWMSVLPSGCLQGGIWCVLGRYYMSTVVLPRSKQNTRNIVIMGIARGMCIRHSFSLRRWQKDSLWQHVCTDNHLWMY